MNGPKHYREAERLLDVARNGDLIAENKMRVGPEDSAAGLSFVLAEAQVHATLALSAAIIDGLLDNLGAGQITGQPSEWARAVSS